MQVGDRVEVTESRYWDCPVGTRGVLTCVLIGGVGWMKRASGYVCRVGIEGSTSNGIRVKLIEAPETLEEQVARHETAIDRIIDSLAKLIEEETK